MVAPYPRNQIGTSDLVHSFPPVCKSDAHILILGSMPGKVSLQSYQYYAHPQNTFWPIMESLFGILNPLGYPERIRLLTNHRIALWDVLRTCVRTGSLDSSINASSITANDFCAFYTAAPNIQAVFFNGATAEREYIKRVIPTLTEKVAALPNYRLPSTSPAMASLSKEQKHKRWQLIIATLNAAQ